MTRQRHEDRKYRILRHFPRYRNENRSHSETIKDARGFPPLWARQSSSRHARRAAASSTPPDPGRSSRPAPRAPLYASGVALVARARRSSAGRLGPLSPSDAVVHRIRSHLRSVSACREWPGAARAASGQENLGEIGPADRIIRSKRGRQAQFLQAFLKAAARRPLQPRTTPGS